MDDMPKFHVHPNEVKLMVDNAMEFAYDIVK